MAAAYADAGRFELAVSTQKQAVDGVTPEIKAPCIEKLDLYQSGQPYRDVPKTEVATTTAAK